MDEVRPEYQQDCARAIQQWLNSDSCPRQVAICCRREQYEAYSEKLELEVGGSVYLQDLTDEQIQLFLSDVKQPELWENLAADENLLALIRRPLLLSMAVLAYGEIDRNQWQQATSAGDRMNLLLDAYIRRQLTTDKSSRFYRKGKIPSFEQSQKWLEILALQLLQDSETDFLIEKMQPRWLSKSQQRIYILILGLFIGLIVGFLGLFYESTSIRIAGILIGLLILQIERSSLDHHNSIKPPGTIRISLSQLSKHLWTVLFWMIGIFISTIIINRFESTGFSVDTVDEENFLWITMLISSLTCVLVSSSKAEFQDSELSSKAIKNSIQNTVFTSFFCIPVLAYAYGLACYQESVELFFESSLFKFIVPGCLFVSFAGVDGFFVKHFALRLILSWTGSIPGDYTRFLNYAAERLLLQRVGKRYRFMHDLLGESLAQHRINNYSQLIDSKTFARCGENYRLKGQNKKALQNLERAIELNSKYNWAIAIRGKIYQSMGRYEDALKDFNCAIEIDYKIDEAFASKSKFHLWLEQSDKVLQSRERADELNSKYKWVIASRGETYQSIGRYEDALKDFNRAIEIEPGNTSIIASRGETYRSMECYEETLKDFNRATELNHRYDWAIRCRGEVHLMLGQYDMALKDLNYAIELDSKYDFRFYHRAVAYLGLHQSDLSKIDLDGAIEISKKKYTENPADNNNTFNLALYYLVSAEIPTAQNFYQIAIQHNPSDNDIRDAIRDLEDLLKVLNDVPSTQQTIEELKQHLK